MSTYDAMQEAASKLVARSAYHREILADYRAGNVEPFLVNVFAQGRATLADELAAARLVQDFRCGRLAVCRVGSETLDKGPNSDCLREDNRKALSYLPEPFSAGIFDGHAPGADGWLAWSSPLQMTRTDHSDALVDVDLAAGQAPLEVGSVQGTSVFMQLAQGDILARWPYDSSEIVLCKLLRNRYREGLYP